MSSGGGRSTVGDVGQGAGEAGVGEQEDLVTMTSSLSGGGDTSAEMI